MDEREQIARVEALRLATQHLNQVINRVGETWTLPETDVTKQLDAAERYRAFLLGES